MSSRTIITAFFLFCIPASAGFGQNLSGKVVDEEGAPIANVNVSIRSLHRYSPTDQTGRYLFEQLPSGRYEVEFSIIGRRNEIDSLTISGSDVSLDKTLRSSPLEFRPATVTASPLKSDVFNAPEAVDVVESRDLDRLRGSGIMESVSLIPGVALSTAGPMSAKPIIRGLGSQRVVVAENGVRHTGQQWDDDQTPEIDALDVDRIEVMRGPNSVEFGSDALGGVINVVSTDLQMLLRSSSRLSGTLMLNGFTNNGQAAGGLSLYGRNNQVAYKIEGGMRNAGNATTPAGVLTNTGENETSAKAIAGVNIGDGSIVAGFSHFLQKTEILPDPQGEEEITPYQKVWHDNLSIHFDRVYPSLKLTSDLTWQTNEQSEFDAVSSPSPDVELILQSTSFDLKAEHNKTGAFVGAIGISAEHQRNDTRGATAMIPAFDQYTGALFIHEEASLKPLTVAAGFRYDLRQLHVDETPSLRVTDQTRNYGAVSGSIGAVWHATEDLVVATDVSRGWRAPDAEELFVNGVDQGGMRYKTGRADLTTEASLNVDLSLRYISHSLKTELTLFRDRVNDYIYLRSTGERDSASGLIRYVTSQSNATLTGTEFSLKMFLSNELSADCSADVVVGTNDENGEWLSMLSPARINFGLRFSPSSLSWFRKPYVSAGTNVTLDQNRLGEYETRTGGYTLYGAGLGGEIPAGSKNILIDCSVANLFDRPYADHLSLFKKYALNPGRNFILKLTMPFDLLP